MTVGWRNWVLGSVVLTLLAACVVAAPVQARGHLDRSFGEAGVVRLSEDLVDDRSLGSMAAAADGRVYITEEGWVCGRGGCPQDVYLRGYRADGSPDPRFGARRPRVVRTALETSLAVDSAGRPLLAWGAKGGGIVVRRFSRVGRPDRRFGSDGTTFLPCGCRLSSTLSLSGGRLLVVGATAMGRSSAYRGEAWFIARLRADGKLDRGFGRAGVVRMSRPGYFEPEPAPAAGGATLLSGDACCTERSIPFLKRLSTAGVLDVAFAARTSRALRGIPGTHEDGYGLESLSVLPRRGGRIAVIAGSYSPGAAAIGLLANGRRDLSYGRNGVRRFKLQFIETAPDGAGGTFVAGYGRSSYGVLRIGPGGDRDRDFGWLRLPQASNDEGIGILPQGRGRAVVLDPGLAFCRQGCASHPKMFRVQR